MAFRLALRDMLRTSVIQEVLRIKLLLLCNEWTSWSCLGIWHLDHLNTSWLRCLGHALPWGGLRVRSRDYVSELAWECLSVPSRRARGRGSEEGALGFSATQTGPSDRKWMYEGKNKQTQNTFNPCLRKTWTESQTRQVLSSVSI